MAIPFIQFVRPYGFPMPIEIDRPADVEEKAARLREAGYSFEAEVLRTGECSFEIVEKDADGDLVPIAMETCDNGPPVLAAVDRLVNDAYRIAFEENKP